MKAAAGRSPRYRFDVDKLLGEVRAERAARGLTERALAEKLGVTHGLINYHLGNGRNCRDYVNPPKLSVATAVQMLLFLGKTDFRDYLEKEEQ